MIVSLIAAVAANGIIGKDNDLVWDLPVDMKFFKETTKGHVVIMGRRNYDSIPPKWRPLPGRTNVIVTRQSNYEAPGCQIVHSLKEAMECAASVGETEAFIIGGGQIYAEALRLGMANRMYITKLDAPFVGDTYFPLFDVNDWKETLLGVHESDEKHVCGFSIYQYDKNS